MDPQRKYLLRYGTKQAHDGFIKKLKHFATKFQQGSIVTVQYINKKESDDEEKHTSI